MKITCIMLIAGLCLMLAAACPAAPEQPNVVLIVVDALRPDHLGCYGYNRPTSPNIDALAAGGVRFETVITQAPWTKASFPSFLTSLYPFQHGVMKWESVLPETLITLPEVLGDSGYQTVCVVHRVGLDGRFRILQGFQEERLVVKGRRGAANATDAAIGALEACKPPFFLMVHYFDTHKPYRVPDKYVDLVRGQADIEPFHWESGSEVEAFERPSDQEIMGDILLYDAGVRFADEGIGRIVDHLEQTGLLDETVIIVIADHGESFWEHGLPLHTTNVYDQAIKVPLVVSYSHLKRKGEAISEQVRLLDLFPTIADLTGNEIPRQCEGSSLLGLMENGVRRDREGTFFPGNFALCECTTKRRPATRCLRTGGWKIIVESLTYSIELYNLLADPDEAHDLWGKGIAYGDTLLGMIERVPGVRLKGWRLAFTGVGEGPGLRGDLSLPQGGRFERVETLTRQAGMSIELDPDSTRCTLTTEEHGLHMLLINTRPSSVPVSLEMSRQGGEISCPVYYGSSGEAPAEQPLFLTTETGAGTPGVFKSFMKTGRPGVHIWWMSGEEISGSRETSPLSPEELERLKSLGYIN